MELTILMPCLNEAETLAICIRRAKKLLDDNAIDGEILISDNGSIDDSREIALREGARVVQCPLKGYGAALQFGIENAKGKFIIMGDSDDSYHFDEAFPMLEKLREGFDCCMGTRLMGTIMPGAMPILHRYLGNPVLTTLGRMLFGIPMTDFHCGMRSFRKDKLLQLGLVTTGMEWASEMVIKCQLAKLRMTEVPITLYKDGRNRPPHLRSWRDGWRHLRFMLLHAPMYLFTIPGIFMFICGVVGTTVLSQTVLQIGKVQFDVQSLLVMAFLVILGLQTIFTGLFAKLYSYKVGILPPSGMFISLARAMTLERLLVTFSFLGIAGVALFGQTLWLWYETGFAELNYRITLRQMIPAMTLITLSVQGIFNAFMLSLLTINTTQHK